MAYGRILVWADQAAPLQAWSKRPAALSQNYNYPLSFLRGWLDAPVNLLTMAKLIALASVLVGSMDLHSNFFCLPPLRILILSLTAFCLLCCTAVADESNSIGGEARNSRLRYGIDWHDERFRAALGALRQYNLQHTNAEAIRKLSDLRLAVTAKFGTPSLELAAVINEQGHAYTLYGDFSKAHEAYSEVIVILDALTRSPLSAADAPSAPKPKTDTSAPQTTPAADLPVQLAEIVSRYGTLGLYPEVQRNEMFIRTLALSAPDAIRDGIEPGQIPASGPSEDTESNEQRLMPDANSGSPELSNKTRRHGRKPINSGRKSNSGRWAQSGDRRGTPNDPYAYRYEPRPYYPYYRSD